MIFDFLNLEGLDKVGIATIQGTLNFEIRTIQNGPEASASLFTEEFGCRLLTTVLTSSERFWSIPQWSVICSDSSGFHAEISVYEWSPTIRLADSFYKFSLHIYLQELQESFCLS